MLLLLLLLFVYMCRNVQFFSLCVMLAGISFMFEVASISVTMITVQITGHRGEEWPRKRVQK